MKNKPKIIQTLYSGLGGHANVVFSLLETSFNQNFTNTLVFFGVENTLESHKLKSKDLKVNFHSILKKPKRYFGAFFKFRKVLKTEKPDFIFIHNSELIFPAIRYKKRAKTKIIYVEHEPNHTKTKFENYQTKYALKYADIVVCLNESYCTELKMDHKILAETCVIPNGINIEKYKRMGKSNSVLTIGMAARLTDTKDHRSLLIAFSKVLKINPNIILKIAGVGNLERELKNQSEKLGISKSVNFVGLLDEKQMIDFYNSIDLYVHATLSETLSTSILQAMSSELIVITSDIINNQQLITNGEDGLFYVNENTDDLYLKMIDVIQNFEIYKKIGKKARIKVEKLYSNNKMNIEYQKIIE